MLHILSVWTSPDCAYAGTADSTILAAQRGVVLSNCTPDVMTRVCIDVTVGIAFIYFALTCALLLLKLSQHRKLPYRRIQVGTVFFRLQVSPQDWNLISYVHNIMTSMDGNTLLDCNTWLTQVCMTHLCIANFTHVPSASSSVIFSAVILLHHALETLYGLHVRVLQMQVQVCCIQLSCSYWRFTLMAS